MAIGNDLVISIKTIAETLGIDKADASLAKLSATQKENELQSTNWGKSMGTAGLVVAGAVTAVAAVSIKSAADYQQQLVKLSTSAGESVGNLKMVGDGMLKIARDTGTGTKELADAMYKVESGGQHGADGLIVLKAAAQGAKAEGSDLTTVADALTSVLIDYHLKAADAADVTSKLVAATAAGKMSFQDLAGAMPAILPVASAAHVSLNDILGDMASMTVHGMSAQQAAENLTDVIRHMQAPTAQQGKELALLGLTTTQLADDMKNKGLAGTLQEISEKIAHLMPPGSDKVILNLKDALNGLSQPVKDLGMHLFDGSMSMKEYNKAAAALDPISAKQASSFATLAGSMHKIGDAQMTGADVMQNYGQALYKATGDATGLKVALMLTGENAQTTNDAIKSISGATAEAGGNVKGWSEIQGEFNTKMAQFGQVINTTLISVGTKMLPVVTDMVGGLVSMSDHLDSGGKKIYDVVKPALQGLGDVIVNGVIPAFKAVLTSDFVRTIGVVLVGAVIAATVVLTGLLNVVSTFVRQIAPMTPLLIGVTAAIIGFRVATLAYAAAQQLAGMYIAATTSSVMLYNGTLITVKGTTVAATIAQEALNTAMKMNPYVLVASAAIGIVTAYISVVTQSDKTKSATDRLRDAQDQLKTSSDKLKDAQHQLSDATFNQEGASLRAEAAQKNYNDMVKQYGPDSLEARQALHEMKGANDDLAKANDTVKQKTQDKTNAEKDNANKKQVVVDAEHAKQREIDTTNNRIGMQILTLDTLSGKLNNLNGKVFNYTVNGAYYDYASKAKATGSGAPYKLPGMATGGNVDPGTAYVVGDNPDGSLNSTSEVFVPHTPGTILNSRDLKDVLMAKKEGGSAPSQVTTTNHFYVTINDMNAATAFFDKLDRDGILASKGLTTNRGMS